MKSSSYITKWRKKNKKEMLLIYTPELYRKIKDFQKWNDFKCIYKLVHAHSEEIKTWTYEYVDLQCDVTYISELGIASLFQIPLIVIQ